MTAYVLILLLTLAYKTIYKHAVQQWEKLREQFKTLCTHEKSDTVKTQIKVLINFYINVILEQKLYNCHLTTKL